MLRKWTVLLLFLTCNLFAAYKVSTIDLLSAAGLTCNAGGPLLVRCDSLRNRIILANSLTSSISLIDGRTHFVHNIPLTDRVPPYLKNEAMTIDEANGTIYLIGNRCFFIIRPNEQTAEKIVTAKQFESIAVDPSSGNVFLAGQESAALAFYDAGKKKFSLRPWLQRAELLVNMNATPPPSIRKVVADPSLKQVAAVDGFSSMLYMLDAKTGRVLQQRPLALNPGGRWHLAGYDVQRHRLYVVIETTDRRIVQTASIDMVHDQDLIVPMPELREGAGVLYNPRRQEVYIPYDNAACVHVVDFKNPVQEIALPSFGNDATALDQARQLLYVASWPQGDVEVVDLVARKFIKRISHKGILPHMFSMAFNPHNGLLYIPKGATAVNGSFGAALMTLDPNEEKTEKIYTGWLPIDLIEWEKGNSFLVFNNEDQMVLIDDEHIKWHRRLPVEYPIQALANAAVGIYLSYGSHQSYWPNVYIWDAANGVLTLNPDLSYYDRRIPRQAQKMVLDRDGVLHFTQNPWGTEEQFLGNLPDAVRLFEAGTRTLLGDQVDRETTQRLLCYDPTLHRLYLARVAEADSSPGILQIIDPKQKKVLSRTLIGRCPTDLTFDDANIYVANFLSHSISSIDKQSFNLHTIPAGGQPLKLAVLGPSLWVINHEDNSLQEAKGKDQAIAIPASGKPDNLFVWQNQLLITAHDQTSLTVLAFNPQARTFEKVLTNAYPYGNTSFAAINASFFMTGQYGDVVYNLNQGKEDSNGRFWLTDFLSGKVFVISQNGG